MNRKIAALAAALLVAGAMGGTVLAAGATVPTLTGCLANKDATLIKVKLGDSPATPCSSGQTLVHLSGGDITSITVGDGLTGGGTNGDITIGLDASFSLPQGCDAGDIVEKTATGWTCGDDNDTTYTAGTGLDLSSGNEFAVEPDYRVKNSTDCSGGQFATGFDGNGTIQCGTATGKPNSFFSQVEEVRLPDDGDPHTIASVSLPAGKYAITVTGWIRGADLGDESAGTCDLSGPSLFRLQTWDAPLVGNPGVIAMTRVATFASNATITVTCAAFESHDQADVESLEIVAISVN